MISTPGSPNIRIDINMVGLPPGMIITASGSTSTLNRLCRLAGPAPAQGAGAGARRSRCREGVFLADAVESRDGFQHGVTPDCTNSRWRAVHLIGQGKSID